MIIINDAHVDINTYIYEPCMYLCIITHVSPYIYICPHFWVAEMNSWQILASISYSQQMPFFPFTFYFKPLKPLNPVIEFSIDDWYLVESESLKHSTTTQPTSESQSQTKTTTIHQHPLNDTFLSTLKTHNQKQKKKQVTSINKKHERLIKQEIRSQNAIHPILARMKDFETKNKKLTFYQWIKVWLCLCPK